MGNIRLFFAALTTMRFLFVVFAAAAPVPSQRSCLLCEYATGFSDAYLRNAASVSAETADRLLSAMCNVIASYQDECHEWVAEHHGELLGMFMLPDDARNGFCVANGFCEETQSELATDVEYNKALHAREAALRAPLRERQDETCAEVKQLLINANLNDAYGLVETMTCVAWIESRWECQAVNSYSEALGLWQFLFSLFAGEWGVCPTTESAFLDCQTNADCCVATILNYGTQAWTPDTTECVSCVWQGSCTGVLSGY